MIGLTRKRPVSQVLEVMDPANVPDLPPAHENCRSCCALGRCCFCAGLVPGVFVTVWKGNRYWACVDHKQDLLNALDKDAPQNGGAQAEAYSISSWLR